MIPDEALEAVEKVLDFHLPDAAHSSGCQLRCGYDGEDLSGHLAQHVLEAAAPFLRAQALEDAASAAFKDKSIQGLRRVLIGNYLRARVATEREQA